MQGKDQFDFVRQHIRKNRLRVFMTVLAATMGTAFLIILASVGFGIQDTLRKEILDNRLVTQIEVYAQDLDAEKPEDMKKIEHVNAVVLRQSVAGWQKMELDGYTGYNTLTSSDFAEEAKAGFALDKGRLPKSAHEVVVGHDFAMSLVDEADTPDETADGSDQESELPTYKGDLLGKTFTYELGDYTKDQSFGKPVELKIVGVAKAPAKDFIQDNRVYADAALVSELEKIYQDNMPEENSDPLFGQSLNVYADKLENVKTITQVLKDDGYDVYSISEELDQIDVFFLALKAGLIFVGTIAILISSIGIFNTMTMAVTERTREIGVMKALGAKPKLIQRLFLLESAWIGLIGTVIAIVLSYGISFLANYILPIIVGAALGEEEFGELNVTFSIIPWQLVLIASAISLTVAMVSGWRPARKATQIDVIDALRQEL